MLWFLKYWLLALLRFVGLALLYPWRKEQRYVYPAELSGYCAWVQVPLFGVVAFRRVDTHTLQYHW